MKFAIPYQTANRKFGQLWQIAGVVVENYSKINWVQFGANKTLINMKINFIS